MGMFGIPDPICDRCGDTIKADSLDDVIGGTAKDSGRRDVQYGKRREHANKACDRIKPYQKMVVDKQTFGDLTVENAPFTTIDKTHFERVTPGKRGKPSKLDNARA